MTIPTRSVDNFVAQCRGAAICINIAQSELLDWWSIPPSHREGLAKYLAQVAVELQKIGDEFDKAAHGKDGTK